MVSPAIRPLYKPQAYKPVGRQKRALSPAQVVACRKWGWATTKKGGPTSCQEELDDFIVYCRECGELPPIHKDVKKHWRERATNEGWFVPLDNRRAE